MTQLEWQHLESLIAAMTPEDKQRLVVLATAPRSEVAPSELAVAQPFEIVGGAPVINEADLLRMTREEQMEFFRQIAEQRKRMAARRKDEAARSPRTPAEADDPFIGCMADESELLDEIMEGIYHDRENLPLRAPAE